MRVQGSESGLILGFSECGFEVTASPACEPPISGFALGLRCCRDWLQRLDEVLIGCDPGAWQMVDAASAVIGLGRLLCDVLAGD
jgi:hypothetical protein